MINLLAALTLVAQAIVVACVLAGVARLLGRRGPLDALVRVLGGDALRLAWLVAAVAMAGSLYFSESRHFLPCTLCWYQRIAMYPLVIVLGVAALANDRRVGRTVLPLVGIGALVSAYHYQLERFPEQESIACSSTVPCTTIWFEAFGFITIPMMAFSGFALIAVLVWLGGLHGKGIAREA